MDEVLEKHVLDKMPPDAPCIPAENFIKANEAELTVKVRHGLSIRSFLGSIMAILLMLKEASKIH